LTREIPAELERIMTKALARERTQRFQTVAEMALQLRTLKEDLTLESRLKQFRNTDGVYETSSSRVAPDTERASVRRTSELAGGPGTSVKYGISKVKQHKAVALTAALILLVASMGFFYVLKNQNKSSTGPIAKKSIAVLPLRPVDAANRNEAYEVAVAESLIYRISLMNGFVVRSLNATRRYGDFATNPIDVGKEH